ncbi:MAG TPA: hypothetical protein VIZ65_05710 [Cellvibrionaceae bacterium]
MKAFRPAGYLFIAVALIAFGIQHFIYLDFITRVFAPFPTWIPAHAIFAVFAGVFLCLTGAAILQKTYACILCLALAGTILLMFIIVQLPNLIANLSNPMIWTNAGKALVLAGVSLIAAGSLAKNEPKFCGKLSVPMISLGKLFLAGFFMLAAVMHFLYADFVATLIPTWIPAHLFWTYFAAIALIAGALGMFISKTKFYAAALLALMIFLWLILLHAPRAIADLHNANETTAFFEALAMCGACLLIASKKHFHDFNK